MPADPNPYRPPEAPIDAAPFPADPGPRTFRRFLAAALHFALAAFVLSIEGLFIWALIDLWSRAGTKWENHPTRFGIRELIILPIGLAGLAFLLAGRSIWQGQKDQGIGRSAAGFAILGLTALAGWLLPRP